jgi:predicted secreted protein
MYVKRIAGLAILILAGVSLWAGDIAVFVDLGFSPDGKTYMFGQYGVKSETLRPWADLYLVDVASNSFIPGGAVSYVHDAAVPSAGQDGSGALYRLIAKNAAAAERRGISFLLQGQPLYVSMENGAGGESIEFRDFEKSASFRAKLNVHTESSGTSFDISLERLGGKSYTVGNSRIKRNGVAGYKLRKVISAPGNGSIIFVIEMWKPRADGGIDLSYMVETVRL